MNVTITQISETNYTEEMPTGNVEIESIEALMKKTGATIEIDDEQSATLTCEWGNGEGQDQFEIVINDGLVYSTQTTEDSSGSDWVVIATVKLNNNRSEYDEHLYYVSLDTYPVSEYEMAGHAPDGWNDRFDSLSGAVECADGMVLDWLAAIEEEKEEAKRQQALHEEYLEECRRLEENS